MRTSLMYCEIRREFVMYKIANCASQYGLSRIVALLLSKGANGVEKWRAIITLVGKQELSSFRGWSKLYQLVNF
jgi:hypothetical protein